MALMTAGPSRRGWRVGALLVGGVTAAGLIAWGVAPWLATLVGVTPVLLAVACAIPCVLPLVLLRRGGGCRATGGGKPPAACRSEPAADRVADDPGSSALPIK
jgi:hypothetical protein